MTGSPGPGQMLVCIITEPERVMVMRVPGSPTFCRLTLGSLPPRAGLASGTEADSDGWASAVASGAGEASRLRFPGLTTPGMARSVMAACSLCSPMPLYQSSHPPHSHAFHLRKYT